jgi:hypothetical protein
MKIPVKLNKEKQAKFDILVAQLIEEGFDVALNNQQQTVTFYLNHTDSMYSLNLHADGTWTLE